MPSNKQGLDQHIFITGSTGFLGVRIVEALLQQGYTNIFCLHRGNSDTEVLKQMGSAIRLIEGDIMDVVFLEDALKSIDVVIHSAAIVSMDPSQKEEMIKMNVEGTSNVVNMCLESGVKKLIHISSIAAIGRRKFRETIDENNKWAYTEFNTQYGLSKFLAEQEAWRGYNEGLSVCIVNPSYILGPGHSIRSSLRLVQKLKDGLTHYPTGSNGFVDVRDVAIAVVKLIEPRFDGDRYIINEGNYPYRLILTQLAGHMELPAPAKALKGISAKLALWVEAIKSKISGKAPVITRESLMTGSLEVRYLNNKSINELGMVYRTMEETLKETAKTFK
jgi:dihydroflavonol-4-reductase